jgi:Methyltransferase domain
MNYGAMTKTDADVLEAVLEAVADRHRKTLSFLEVGVHTGGTARGVQDWCMGHGFQLHYVGVESGAICTPTVPFEGARLVVGDSIVVWKDIDCMFDCAFIDGDHGGNHVILDTLHYGAKVKVGGIMVFHDTAPEIQHDMREAEGPDHPWWYNSVLDAHKLLRFPSNNWELFETAYEKGSRIGGMTAYRKLAE